MSEYFNPEVVVTNVNHVVRDFGEGEYVAVAFFDKEGAQEVQSFLYVNQDSFPNPYDILRSIENQVFNVYMNDASVVSCSMVVHTGRQEYSAQLARLIAENEKEKGVKVNNLIATDGFRWEDVVTLDEGLLNSELITVQQLEMIVEGDTGLRECPESD